MRQVMQVTRRLAIVASVSALAACGASNPASVRGLDRAVGQELPGAQGRTLEDQDRIDDTVARGCASGVFRQADCARHSGASAERRRELVERTLPIVS